MYLAFKQLFPPTLVYLGFIALSVHGQKIMGKLRETKIREKWCSGSYDTKEKFYVQKILCIILEGLPIQRNCDCKCMQWNDVEVKIGKFFLMYLVC